MISEHVEKMMEVPQPPPELAHLSRAALRDKLWRGAGGREPVRPWAGPVADIYYGWMGLGRDMNGTTLSSERESWLRVSGWVDPGEVEAGHYFFSVMESEMADIHKILYPPHKD